jgi:cytochrome c-type biogenesis protein CcmH
MTDPAIPSAAPVQLTKSDDRPSDSPTISTRNRWLLAGAGVLLAGALAFAFMRAPAPSGAPAAGTESAAAASSQGAALEARVAANPNDASAWTELAQFRFDSQDYPGAVTAFRRATELAPTVAGNWSALGEASVYSAPNSGPPIPDAAVTAFRRALSLDAADPRARYFLAAKKDVDGDHEGAIRDWLTLLADTPTGAPWEADLRRTVQQVGARNNIVVQARLDAVRQRAMRPSELPVAARAIPGPSREQMQSAAALPKGQQDMMIDGMVNGLQQQLEANPRQPDRWIMLMRSRMTLGQAQQAGQALQSAIRANPAQADRLRAQARLLGVPGSGANGAAAAAAAPPPR